MHRIVVMLALLLAPLAARGEAADWLQMSTPVFTNIGVDQGLPHPFGMAVAQDSVGFIWVGTQGGLARYDGYRFTTFQHKDDDTGAVLTDFIDDLAAGTEGRMWVADYSGNIARYEPATETFRPFPEPAGTPGRGFIERVIADGKGGVWVGTTTGLEHIAGDSGTITRYRSLSGEGQAADHIRALAKGRDGRLWVSTDQGLWRRQAGSDHFDKVALPSEEITDRLLLAMSEDAEGRLWFGTSAAEIGRVDTDGSVHKVAQLPSTAVRRVLRLTMTQARPGELWIGQYGGGVYVLTMASGRLRNIRHDPGVPLSLPDNAVRSMITDHGGRVWMTTGRGISYISPQSEILDSILPSSEAGGISDVDLLSMAAAPDGKIWLDLSEQGVATLDPVKGRVTVLPRVAELPLASVPGLAVDPDGTLWVGAIGSPGLYHLDGRTGHLLDSGWVPEKTMVYRRVMIQAGFVWVAAGPLVRFDPKTGQTRVFRHSDDPTSLIEDGAILLAPADGQRIWLATGVGLELFDRQSETFRHFVHDNADPASLPAGHPSVLLTDRRGRLWVGTLGNGIGIGTPDEEGNLRFQRLSVSDGLPNNNITGLLEDKVGRVWVSFAHGLAVIDPETLAVQPLGRADGLAISTYAFNSALSLPDGTLLFGGRGLTVAHPERLYREIFDPPVVVTGLRINGTIKPVSTFRDTVPLVLAPDERSLEVEFAALEYSDSESMLYSYRLIGFDREWTHVDANRRVAAYTNLPPGHYTLQIRGGNRAGAWSRTLSLPVVVLPAWWQSWWFRSLATIAAVAIVILLIRARTAVLHRRSRELEQLVARQTRDLTESNTRLEQLAAQDPLTNLLNRRAFFEKAGLEYERASRYRRPTSLMMIDVDHFKQVNDTHGHGAGDDVLRSLADQIRTLLRNSDMCVRLGGEELAVLMPETEPESALQVAERLRQAVENEDHQSSVLRFRVTISIGLAARRDDESLAALMERADRALYAAKTAGRNRVIVADLPAVPDM